MIAEARQEAHLSVRRLARATEEPVSTVGRWGASREKSASMPTRIRRVSSDPGLRERIRDLCQEDRHGTYGHRRIRALLRRRFDLTVNRKTVARVMRELGLAQPKIRHRPMRPTRVEKMRPSRPNEGWQIDMTSFALADLTPLFLVIVIDAFTRKIVGWTLDRRCRASEWTAAVRMAQEAQGLRTKEDCRALVLRSDNGSQPCSKAFVEFLSVAGIRGQYTGYDAPDDNAFVERVMRTIKEEEVWPNVYESWSEAHAAIESYVRYYNDQRIHSALDYQTPCEVEAKCLSLKAA